MLIALEIAFPVLLAGAVYQQGNQPLFIVDCPAIGNVVELKDCVFQNNVDLRLPNGTVVRGFPRDDMTAEAIRKNTAILEQEGLAANGNAELLARIARMNAEIERIHEEHFIALAADTTETHRLLHRTLRKVEGVPPVLDKLALAGKDMAAATQQFRRTVKMDDDDWEIYNQMELRGHNQTRVARDLGMEPYQISRAWKRIKAAWEAAGYPIAEKVTMGNAVLGEDGVVFKKPTKRRKGRG